MQAEHQQNYSVGHASLSNLSPVTEEEELSFLESASGGNKKKIILETTDELPACRSFSQGVMISPVASASVIESVHEIW